MGRGRAELSLGRCLDDAVRMFGERPVLVLGSTFLAASISALAVVSVVGIAFVVPALVVGIARLGLELHDGDARLATLFSGFRDYGGALRRMLPVMALLAIVALPAGAFQAFALLSGDGRLQLAGVVIGVAWNALLMYPLLFAVLLVADRRLGADVALVTAWRAARGARLQFAVASVVTEIVAYSGLLALGVGVFFSWPFGCLMFVSAYRQIFEQADTSPAG